MNTDTILDQASLAVLLLEGLKYAVRFILRNPAYDFSKTFYVIILPVMQAVSALLLAVLGVTGYTFPTDWLGYARGIVLMILGSLVSVVVYQGYKKVRDYIPARNLKKTAKK
jgi:hypothetical protein